MRMTTPAQHRLTLRFHDPTLEAQFYAVYHHQSLRQVRYALALGVLLYGFVFAVVDWINVPEFVGFSWSVRAVVTTLGLGVLALTWTAAFYRLMQPLLSLLLVVAGGGLILMLAFEPSGKYYFDGPVLVILPAYMMFRLRFVYATVVGWLIVGMMMAVGYLFKDVTVSAVLSSAIFYASANLIGMFAGYMLEEYARKDFWQTRVIDQKRAQIEGLLRTQSRFFANVSHEFRTPLTLIAGPLDALLQEPATRERLPEHVQQQLGLMQRSTERLLRLINQLLDLARLEARQAQLRAQPTPAEPFVRGLIAAFASQAEQQQIDLRFVQDTPLTESVYLDRDKFEKIVVNLVGNALKFTPEGGSVRVALAAEEGSLVLRVRDTGPGIPAADLPYVFDRFRQADSAPARSTGGSGIGLALVRELAALHHGEVTAQSEPGFGSEFIVRLPLGEAHLRPADLAERSQPLATPEVPDVLPASAEEAAALLPAPDETQPTLLLVDDHPDMRTYLRHCLGESYHYDEAADGHEALERARTNVPDLIITDVMMPGLDGHAFSQALKADPVLDHIPVVMLTAKATSEDEAAGLDTGADAFLAKPFNPRALQAHVRNLLATRQRLRARFQESFRTSSAATADPVAVPSADEAFVARARAMVEENLANEFFDVDAFAEAMGMSRRQLQRKLRAVTGETPVSFVRRFRLSRAAQLLAQQYGTVAEVAYAVGFSDPSYFARCFREEYGSAPSEYEGAKVPEG